MPPIASQIFVAVGPPRTASGVCFICGSWRQCIYSSSDKKAAGEERTLSPAANPDARAALQPSHRVPIAEAKNWATPHQRSVFDLYARTCRLAREHKRVMFSNNPSRPFA